MSAFSAPARPAVDVAVLQGEIEAIFGFRCSGPSFVAGGQDTDASVLRATTTEGQEVAVKVSRRAGRPGGLLAQVHGARLPAELASHIPREDYRTPATADLHEVDQWLMRLISADVKADGAADPLCRHLAQSRTAARPGIRLVAEQAEVLSAELSRHPAADVLCHGDAHIFNTVLDQSGHVWLVDWDEAVLAPRERDVAERAGHSVDVLLRVYAKCIDGQQEIANKRIGDALAA
ncbi:phosphotransferase family protein [Nonomuraea sp. NPDC049480]|uniref:phosphotransferase family protein n=1 Tax=Nonomuraea sp. NPDC049480 TaxID=3364353 RepID=UPI0037BC4E60